MLWHFAPAVLCGAIALFAIFLYWNREEIRLHIVQDIEWTLENHAGGEGFNEDLARSVLNFFAESASAEQLAVDIIGRYSDIGNYLCVEITQDENELHYTICTMGNSTYSAQPTDKGTLQKTADSQYEAISLFQPAASVLFEFSDNSSLCIYEEGQLTYELFRLSS